MQTTYSLNTYPIKRRLSLSYGTFSSQSITGGIRRWHVEQQPTSDTAGNTIPPPTVQANTVLSLAWRSTVSILAHHDKR